MTKQFNSHEILKSFDNINPNYQIKFLVANNVIVQYLGKDTEIVRFVSLLHNGENLIQDKYLHGKERFDSAFSDRDYALKNIALNIFMDTFMLSNITKQSFFDYYSYYTACVSAVQVLAYSIGASCDCDCIEKTFIVTLAHLCRSIVHNKNTTNDVIKYINDNGITSPAHLALIIK